MHVMKWARAHRLAAAAVLTLAIWILYRWHAGKALFSSGHATPADAIASGWVVEQAGITGWLETSPDGASNIMHDTGWSDPYKGTG